MDAFEVVDIVEEPRELPLCVGEIEVVGEIDLLFLDGSHELFGVSVFAGFADGGHAGFDAERRKAIHVGESGVLDALIGVVDLRGGHGQGAFEGEEGQSVVEG